MKINTDFQRAIKTSLKSRSRANSLKPFLRGKKSPTSSGLMNPGISVFFSFLPSNHEIQSITNFNVKQRVNNKISNNQFDVLLNILYFKCRPTKNNMITNTWTRRQCYVRMLCYAYIFMKIKIKFKIFFLLFFFFPRKLILSKKKTKTKMFALKWHIQK